MFNACSGVSVQQISKRTAEAKINTTKSLIMEVLSVYVFSMANERASSHFYPFNNVMILLWFVLI